MKFIDLAFRLGVIFAIFGFLWGILNMILNLLRGGKTQSVFEEYLLKTVQYFLLVDVTFLFCVSGHDSSILMPKELMLTGLILLLYFTGKLQKRQRKSALFEAVGNSIPQFRTSFNLKAEIIVISLSLVLFTLFIIYPSWSENVISTWFYDSILNIEDTPVFGFIFKVIGFFFLLGILTKLINGIAFLITGAPLLTVRSELSNQKNQKDDENKFDDYEEMK